MYSGAQAPIYIYNQKPRHQYVYSGAQAPINIYIFRSLGSNKYIQESRPQYIYIQGPRLTIYIFRSPGSNLYIFRSPGSIIYYAGVQAPMPPELLELYNLYQQELQTRQSEKETNFLSELNVMLRVGQEGR